MTSPTRDACIPVRRFLATMLRRKPRLTTAPSTRIAHVGSDVGLVVEDARDRLEADPGEVGDVVHGRPTIVLRRAVGPVDQG